MLQLGVPSDSCTQRLISLWSFKFCIVSPQLDFLCGNSVKTGLRVCPPEEICICCRRELCNSLACGFSQLCYKRSDLRLTCRWASVITVNLVASSTLSQGEGREGPFLSLICSFSEGTVLRSLLMLLEPHRSRQSTGSRASMSVQYPGFLVSLCLWSCCWPCFLPLSIPSYAFAEIFYFTKCIYMFYTGRFVKTLVPPPPPRFLQLPPVFPILFLFLPVNFCESIYILSYSYFQTLKCHVSAQHSDMSGPVYFNIM